MRQLWQDLSSGEVELFEIPLGTPAPHEVLVRQTHSVISSGTEGMLHRFGQANLLQKAIAQPERLKEVLHKVKNEGLIATGQAVLAKLETPIPLGYSSAGIVHQVGDLVTHLRPGDQVATQGTHGEFAIVPGTLCTRIPDQVPLQDAAAASLAAIALHSTRLMRCSLGESAAVVGLGLLGQLAVQLLTAQGVRVFGWDINAERLAFASEQFGLLPLTNLQAGDHKPRLDAVLVAATTQDDTLLETCAKLCAKQGRLVLLGQAPIELNRRTLYDRELQLQVASAHGAGRYEATYEEQGQDLAPHHVRWSAGRNQEAALFAMQQGRLLVAPLLKRHISLEEAPKAYASLGKPDAPLGILIEYDDSPTQSHEVTKGPRSKRVTHPSVGVIGAGNFAMRTLLPRLAKERVDLDLVISAKGQSAALAWRQFDFQRASTNLALMTEPSHSPKICFVLTRHDSHAKLATTLLSHHKHVFVEKPLATTYEGLEQVLAAASVTEGSLTVGFNRRFAPMTTKLLQARRERGGPVVLNLFINAGEIPPDHWMNQPEQGGRLLGEMCHFIDLALALADSKVQTSHVVRGRGVDPGAIMTLGFEDGSVATITYATQGTTRFPKERIEMVCQGAIARIENWRALKSWDWPQLGNTRSAVQDKGHTALLKKFLHSAKAGGPWPIELATLKQASLLALDAAYSK